MKMRWPGIEPGSHAWKAWMLTIIPPTRLSQAPLVYSYSLTLFPVEKMTLEHPLNIETAWNVITFINESLAPIQNEAKKLNISLQNRKVPSIIIHAAEI